MPIESFTGLPGNGKTTLMVEKLVAESKKGERPIFAAGIDGLAPGIATVLQDPRQWNQHDPHGEPTCDCHQDGNLHAHVVPDGALIFVDEAWKWFGHLHDATRQQTPKHVLDLAEHRHRGIDFVWTFQQPNQIYPFARGLMADHHHVVRRFGTKFIDVFTWSELNEDVKSAAKRDAAIRKTRTLPEDAWTHFKSAEVHTIKARIPWKILLIPVGLILAVLLGWYAFNALRPETVAADMAGKKKANAAQAASPSGSRFSDDNNRKQPLYANAAEYAQAHLPRIGMMPWTAPVYDDRGITADPQLFCMSSREGQGDDGEWKGNTCTCLTEQGTAYELSPGECRNLARFGPPHNPYKERHQDAPAQQQPVNGVTGPVAPSDTLPGSVIARRPAAVNQEGKDLTPGTAP